MERKWFITADEEMGRIPKRKEKKWEQEIREYCGIEKLQPGCLIELLIRLKKGVPQPKRLGWMRWWCVKVNKCKHYKGKRDFRARRISTDEEIPIGALPRPEVVSTKGLGPKGKGEEIETLFKQGLSGYAIAKRIGAYPSEIYSYLKRRGLR